MGLGTDRSKQELAVIIAGEQRHATSENPDNARHGCDDRQKSTIGSPA